MAIINDRMSFDGMGFTSYCVNYEEEGGNCLPLPLTSWFRRPCIFIFNDARRVPSLLNDLFII